MAPCAIRTGRARRCGEQSQHGLEIAGNGQGTGSIEPGTAQAEGEDADQSEGIEPFSQERCGESGGCGLNRPLCPSASDKHLPDRRASQPIGWCRPSRALSAVVGLSACMGSGLAPAQHANDPFHFFEGVTESVSTMKVVMRRPMRTRAVGRGEIQADGTLSLVQRVEDEGRPPYLRRWLIRQIGPRHFVGTMSEASGPVAVDEIGDRFRFRFRMSGSVSVEQWLTPLPGGRTATSDMTARKFGIAVASAEGVVRKIS